MGHFGISDKVQFLILSGGYKGNTSNLYICFVHFSVFFSKTKVETKIIQAAGEDGLDWGGGMIWMHTDKSFCPSPPL